MVECGELTTITENPNKCYRRVLNIVLQKGRVVKPRGLKTYELQPYTHIIRNPTEKFCSVPGRRANPFFNIAENMWILGGHGDTEWICSYNCKLFEYQGDEGFDEFNAAYGRRIRFANKHREKKVKINKYIEMDVSRLPVVDQLLHCYETLKADVDSRQAVVSLWNPVLDYHSIKTKDRPCNCLLMFKIRDGGLNMTVCNRSNDINLGLYGVNFCQFSQVQEFLAAALNVEIGQYVHLSDSLHVYSDSPVTERILNATYEYDVYDYVKPSVLYYNDLYDKKSESEQLNLNSFLVLADEIISETLEFRNNRSKYYLKDKFTISKFKFCKNIYTESLVMYLFAYDLQKDGNVEKCIELLKEIYLRGFKDLAILGFEFIMRKEENKKYDEVVTTFIIHEMKNTESSTRTIQYIREH